MTEGGYFPAKMKTLMIVLILGQGADITTSIMAFNRGASESNPLVIDRPPAAFLAESIGFTAFEVVFLNKLSKHHPKIAKGLSYVQIGGSSAAATHNALVIHRLGVYNSQR